MNYLLIARLFRGINKFFYAVFGRKSLGMRAEDVYILTKVQLYSWVILWYNY